MQTLGGDKRIGDWLFFPSSKSVFLKKYLVMNTTNTNTKLRVYLQISAASLNTTFSVLSNSTDKVKKKKEEKSFTQKVNHLNTKKGKCKEKKEKEKNITQNIYTPTQGGILMVLFVKFLETKSRVTRPYIYIYIRISV